MPSPQISAQPLAGSSAQALRMPLGRSGAAPATHTQSQSLSWADSIKQAAFRSGHSRNPSNGSAPLVISTPLSNTGTPIIPPTSGARVVRTPREALDTARPVLPNHSAPSLAMTDNEWDQPPAPPAKPFALAIRTRSPQRGDSPRSSPQRQPVSLPATPPSPVAHISPTALVSPPPPPFRPILLSKMPGQIQDVSRLIVKLETATTCFKTTFHTLVSRPSLLTSLLHEVVGSASEGGSASSEYPVSPDPLGSMFKGDISSTVLSERGKDEPVHIFLDRPSEPYVHILTYLRATGSHLPHAVKLSSKIEDLVALRDEARFLELNDLAQLCAEELLQHRMVRSRSSGAVQIVPLNTERSRTLGSPPRAPAPLLTHFNASSHAVQIVQQEQEPRSAIARHGYI
ncbi:hypothetical protein BKA62DRAFT_690340 [Auriculariales sp. MPI-PUGE-AT-0066]|nr:hypothetical protein BKA62DRAFT_690340 [Auriculariales sp. MPI-PUGE-AT-0066]